MSTNEIDIVLQKNSDGTLSYFRYKYRGSWIKIALGYKNSVLNKILIPSALKLSQNDVARLILQLYIEEINTINTINLINTITSIGTINTISNIANIGNIPVIPTVDGALPVQVSSQGEFQFVDSDGNAWMTLAGGIAGAGGANALNIDSGVAWTLPKAAGRTSIVADAQANNSTNALHTVSAGKVFYLVGLSLQLTNSSAAVGQGAITIGGTQILLSSLQATSNGNTHLPLAVPMPFPAGTVFNVVSYNTSCFANGSLIGWEDLS